MVKRLIRYSLYNLPEELKVILGKYKYVFNPSFVRHNSSNYLAVRVYDEQLKKIVAIVFTWKDSTHIDLINLSEYFSLKLKLMKVADPKLFIMDDKVYVTFNTGDAATGDFNQLFLIELEKNVVKEYYECDYKNRTRIEKNWAFYLNDKELYVLYNLSPLTILKLNRIRDNKMFFDKFYTDLKQNFSNFSIGTPLVKIDDGYGFIAHKKYYTKRRRLYLGRVCKFIFSEKPKLKVKNNILLHSLKSLLGNKHKFNKRLISCTYFSGIYRNGDEIVLSYGVNDVSWYMPVLKKEELWP